MCVISELYKNNSLELNPTSAHYTGHRVLEPTEPQLGGWRHLATCSLTSPGRVAPPRYMLTNLSWEGGAPSHILTNLSPVHYAPDVFCGSYISALC